MSAEAILERLQGVRRNGAGWTARCPAHQDRSPSLSVRNGEGGRILVHCFAGCTVDGICAGLGITVADLFVRPREPRKPEPAIVQHARRVANQSLSRNLPRSVREQPLVMIFTDANHVDAAIARALALAVEHRELVQVALKGNAL
jgi:hypothetical protein